MHFFKPIDYNWAENISGLLIGFYVQPFIFSLRGELLLPTLRRTKKIAKLSVTIEAALFILIGFLGYYLLGDRFTPKLFILRQFDSQPPFFKYLFLILIFGFFIFVTLGLSMYNPSIRDYIGTFMNVDKNRKIYYLVSLLPFYIICLGAAMYPKIIKVLNLFGYTVYNFNGYILPFMMYIATSYRYEYPVYKRYMAFVGLFFFVALGVACLIFVFIGKIEL